VINFYTVIISIKSIEPKNPPIMVINSFEAIEVLFNSIDVKIKIIRVTDTKNEAFVEMAKDT
jgi:hypothetical protein